MRIQRYEEGTYHWALNEGTADLLKPVLDALERNAGHDVASHNIRNVVLQGAISQIAIPNGKWKRMLTS